MKWLFSAETSIWYIIFMVDTEMDPELDAKAKRVTEKTSEALHLLSHEPSLALYRLQEHVRKSLPIMVEKKVEANKLQAGLMGACFDVENSIDAMNGMKKAVPIFTRIHDMLKSSMFLKQQLDYERSRKSETNRRDRMYHVDSSDSLFQELRKTKSLGYLKESGSDLVNQSTASVASLSTRSTPVSEIPPAVMSRDISEDDHLWIAAGHQSAAVSGPGRRVSASGQPSNPAKSEDGGDGGTDGGGVAGIDSTALLQAITGQTQALQIPEEEADEKVVTPTEAKS